MLPVIDLTLLANDAGRCFCRSPTNPAGQDRPASSSFVSGADPDELFYSALVGDAAHPTRPSLGQASILFMLTVVVRRHVFLKNVDECSSVFVSVGFSWASSCVRGGLNLSLAHTPA